MLKPIIEKIIASMRENAWKNSGKLAEKNDIEGQKFRAKRNNRANRQVKFARGVGPIAIKATALTDLHFWKRKRNGMPEPDETPYAA